MKGKVVVFCTSFDRPRHPYYTWNVRYRIWIEAIKRSGLHYDQIVLVDDASQNLPDWRDVRILKENDDLCCDDELVVFQFSEHLGRKNVTDFAGWVRSFFFLAEFAKFNEVKKIIHIESDAFLISKNAVATVNGIDDGWQAFWCDRYIRPESAIQIIAGSGLHLYQEWAKRPVGSFSGVVIETSLPFTYVNKTLKGYRYGEEGRRVSHRADWCTQAFPGPWISYRSYFWWLPWLSAEFPYLDPEPVPPRIISHGPKLTHTGMSYLQWLKSAEQILGPESYLEIGTHNGNSLKMISCDAVCVDPRFAIKDDVILRRKTTCFFQRSSEEFFAENQRVRRLFPAGIDLAFLDGLHICEVLLMDFRNTERFMNPEGMIVIHDCLPLNYRMTSRKTSYGNSEEPQETRTFWTGDVWKLTPILKKYRPELRISFLDCPPTGLVVCTGFDVDNNTLEKREQQIREEFNQLQLDEFGLERLWNLFPTYDSRQITSHEFIFRKALFGE